MQNRVSLAICCGVVYALGSVAQTFAQAPIIIDPSRESRTRAAQESQQPSGMSSARLIPNHRGRVPMVNDMTNARHRMTLVRQNQNGESVLTMQQEDHKPAPPKGSLRARMGSMFGGRSQQVKQPVRRASQLSVARQSQYYNPQPQKMAPSPVTPQFATQHQAIPQPQFAPAQQYAQPQYASGTVQQPAMPPVRQVSNVVPAGYPQTYSMPAHYPEGYPHPQTAAHPKQVVYPQTYGPELQPVHGSPVLLPPSPTMPVYQQPSGVGSDYEGSDDLQRLREGFDSPAPRRPRQTRDYTPSGSMRSIGEIRPFPDYVPPGSQKLVPSTQLPIEKPLDDSGYVARNMQPRVYQWKSTNLFYRPLYFEDPQLERYGHGYPFLIQPIVSTYRFGLQLSMMPWQMAKHKPNEPISPLGWHRPGDAGIPMQHLAMPVNPKADLVEATVIAGLFFLIP